MARSVTVGLAVLSLILAGCIGGKEDPVTDAATNETGGSLANPNDGKTLVAFEETNRTVEGGTDGVDHHHDMWKGQTRVEIFSTSEAMAPYDASDGAEYEARAAFNVPDGKFIYEGTASVEFTISEAKRHACTGRARLGGYWICTDTGDDILGAPEVPPVDDPQPPAGLKLRYKHASTTNWIDVGELTWGTPLAIKINVPTETDMPHATTSAWSFEVLSPNKQDATLLFTASATIVRGEGEVPLWPAHPDFYAESCCRVVLDTPAQACDTAGCQLAPSAEDVVSQRLISYGTRTLYVWINITSVTADPVLAPDVWFLWHWNSSGRDNVTNVFDTTGHPFTMKEHAWVLPVDDNGMDSPYADGSKWRFALGGAFFKGGLSCYGGCANWAADYTIKVIATNEVLPLEEYDMACLRDDYCPEPEDAGTGESGARLVDVVRV